MKYAAIDVGSNAIRLFIAHTILDKQEIIFKKEMIIRVPLRLGDDAFLRGKISKRKSRELIKTMVAFRNLIDVFKADKYLAYATAAFRESQNGAELVKKIHKKVNISLEIIDGKKEAEIIYATHIADHLNSRQPYLYIDVGGGSTELTLFFQFKKIASASFNMGSIRIMEHRDSKIIWEKMKNWVRRYTKQYQDIMAIGTGGNISRIYKLSEIKNDKPISFAKIRKICNHLKSFDYQERVEKLGLNPDRADVIIPATEIYLSVMKWANIKEMYVPNKGLVDGMMYEMHQSI